MIHFISKGATRSRTASTLLLAVLGFVFLPAHEAQALCQQPQIAGDWVNVDSRARGITRAIVDYRCGDQRLNGVRTPSGYTLRFFGSCYPRDCDWGTVRAYGGGNFLYTVISHGFAVRFMYVQRIVSGSSEYLRVWNYTNFVDPRRRDYIAVDLLRRR